MAGEQVMFNEGNERSEYCEGLGLIAGSVNLLDAQVVPHMGWNTVQAPDSSSLFNNIASERFYFVHSYAAHAHADGSPIGVATLRMSLHKASAGAHNYCIIR